MSTGLPEPLTAPRVAAHVSDIQAILDSGFAPLRYCTYSLLRVADAARACAWLGRVLQAGMVRSVADLGKTGDTTSGIRKHVEAATLAFSYQGLRALGIAPCDDYPFPSPFASGMADPYRAPSARDEPDDDWAWGDVSIAGKAQAEVHVLLAHFRQDPGSVSSGLLCRAELDGGGFEVIRCVDGCPSYLQSFMEQGQQTVAMREPFGFRDGIAQPMIRDLRPTPADLAARRAVGKRYDDRVVAPGEFILGHENEYGELAYCPNVRGWPAQKNADGSVSSFGFNGSYLAVQQIVQHVERFRDFERQHPSTGDSPSLAEKMVGRRKSGDPLVQCPSAPADADAFRYRVADFDGFQCPRGAHVRRANPRDMLGWDVESGIAASKLHRLLRRGRVYAAGTKSCERAGAPACGDASHMPHEGGASQCAEGLFFMALNADLDRQFAFVQERWLGNRRFADLSGDDDVIAGVTKSRVFSEQGLPIGTRTEGIEQFTTVVGGGYFFVPGLAALAFIASFHRAPDAVA
jgi:putative iron-dependent peroxidase